MTKINVSKSLSAFNLEKQKEFDFGTFTVTLKRFTMTDPKTKATVERIQRQHRRLPPGVQRKLADEVDAFCEISLVGWTLKDDSNKPVPIENAREVFLESEVGQELYYNLMQIAVAQDAFDHVDDSEIDKVEAKN